MAIPAIHRKLLREIGRLKGQVATIALVVASGVTSFVALRGTYTSLEFERDRYYETYRFADVFAQVESAPETLRSRIANIEGVRFVETRIAEEVALPVEGLRGLAYARLLSVPSSAETSTNVLHLRSGRLPVRERDDEVVVLDSFAEAHGLVPGDHIRAVINGKLRRLRVVGVALSPEFVFAVRPGSIAPDPKRYAVLWMDRGVLAEAFAMQGAFNDVSLELEPEASVEGTIAALDRLLARYGGMGAIARKDQASNHILSQELAQLQALSAMIPGVFLAVTAFLIQLVLGRWIRLQRPEIATLKAIGYSNRQIAAHYLGLAGVVLVPGSLLGIAGGWALGDLVIGLYDSVFRFPALEFRMSAGLVAGAVLASAAAAGAGALGAVRSAVRLPPAEAMRPPAPARYRRGLLDRLGLGALAGPMGLMILREIERRPFRTALSALGIAGAVSLLILGRFGWDSFSDYFEETFRREQRYDLSVTFERPMPLRVESQLARLPGVTMAEGIRAVPVQVGHGHRTRDSVLIGLPSDATLRRLVTRDGAVMPVPDEGVVLTKALGDVLGLNVGDRVRLLLREGERRQVEPVVAAFVDETVGLQVYARRETVAELSRDAGAVSQVLLAIDRSRTEAIERRLLESPYVLEVSDVDAEMQRLFDVNASTMNVQTLVTVVLAASVVFGVVYNNARVALTARSRELASLRVLGFSRREISIILLGGLAIEVALAIPIGLLLGRAWAEQFMKSVDPETFRWRVVIAPSSYLLAVAVTLLAAAASALWVRRKLDRLDLVEVLKARE